MGLFKKERRYIYTISIDGMRCGMCEGHVNDLIRKNFNVKKVKSSHLNNNTKIVSLNEIDIKKLNEVISSNGYLVKKAEVIIDE